MSIKEMPFQEYSMFLYQYHCNVYLVLLSIQYEIIKLQCVGMTVVVCCLQESREAVRTDVPRNRDRQYASESSRNTGEDGAPSPNQHLEELMRPLHEKERHMSNENKVIIMF